MTRHLHEPANALLYKALDLPAEERQRFVADACAGEPELLALVRTLLSRIDELDEFLESPHELSAAPRPAPIIDLKQGDAVGSWRLVRELGRDAAGRIFLVERHDGGVARAGALKIAQSASDPLGRIQRDRQILSSLNHPGIARVIDSASAADGRPYFVMEHSEGVAIDQYCADKMLDLPERVALFAPVCRAVHYAHQQLVIHRDLKPANIRIGQDGMATVLNFGLAGEAGEAGGWPPTALFASPEQLAGQPLGIASDIYSLGAILYGLLTGRSPNEAEAHGIINVLARPTPASPSDAVTEAAARHYPPLPEFPLDDVLRPDRKLARQLKGDLDRILMKAVALDPAQRYASADEFARDLQRFLDREPVQAARDDNANAVRPRSVLGVMAAGVVTGALLAGGGLALWKVRGAGPAPAPAEQRVAQPSGKPAAGKPAAGMLAELDAAIETAPAADRTQLMGAAQPYLGQLAHARRVTGRLEGAHQAATMSLGLAEQLLLSNPGDPRWRRQLSVARGQVGGILIEQGRTAEGLAELRKALEVRQEIAAADAGNDQAARDVADAHATIGAALRATMDNASAEQEFKLARGVYAGQLQANPADAALRAGLIELEIGRADVQNLQRHGRDAVQTLAALHVLARGANAHLAARIALLDAYIQPRGTPAQAFAAAGQAVSELVKQSESDPLDTYQLRDSAQAWQRTGEIGLRAGQTGPACRYLGLAAKRYEEFAASGRLSAIDKLRQGQLQTLRKDCA